MKFDPDFSTSVQSEKTVDHPLGEESSIIPVPDTHVQLPLEIKNALPVTVGMYYTLPTPFVVVV